jgi:hypothetical protein
MRWVVVEVLIIIMIMAVVTRWMSNGEWIEWVRISMHLYLEMLSVLHGYYFLLFIAYIFLSFIFYINLQVT